MTTRPNAHAPLLTDPIFDGVTDPSLVRDVTGAEWWCVFAHRRANVRLSRTPSIGRCHGTPLGLASSTDQGASWLYRGTLDLPVEPGHNTFWGPTVFAHDGTYHLFTTFIRGVPDDPAWDTHGRPGPWHRRIHHLSSTDLWTWRHRGRVALGTDHAVDPCVLRTPDGDWSLWFKDEAAGGALRRVTNPDLDDARSWSAPETVLPDWHESPIVFELGGYHWLVAESRAGLTSYRSEDALTWEEIGSFTAPTGARDADTGPVRSPDVVPFGDTTAYLIYYTQSGRDSFGEVVPTSSQSSVAQVALLRVEDGRLVCDRDAPFAFRLP